MFYNKIKSVCSHKLCDFFCSPRSFTPLMYLSMCVLQYACHRKLSFLCSGKFQVFFSLCIDCGSEIGSSQSLLLTKTQIFSSVDFFSLTALKFLLISRELGELSLYNFYNPLMLRRLVIFIFKIREEI